jgi:nitroimidazol reductase NimA-like FMN-containing flavoprotein (pyridoxamine 5'-phosphate oxidase superfamily)
MEVVMPDVPVRPQPRSDRVRVQRLPQRGVYDRAAVHAILDEGLVCHVGFVADGHPFVIPTTYARVGDRLYIHGSAASRMLRVVRDGIPVSVTVTLIDGLVLARSAFHHSMNYRSVVALGTAREVTDPAEKLAALDAIVEHVVPGRTGQTRPPSANELKGTLVLTLPLDEVSAKVRSGPPLDDEEDYALPHWAGVIPLRLEPKAPIADPRLPSGVEAPIAVQRYRRPG